MRKKYVDYIKAVGIILVVLGHINFANSVLKAWIYSFHMPLFFFTSGLTLKSIPVSKEYITKKIHTFIVPYVIWGLIYSGCSMEKLLQIGYGSYYTISRADSLTSLWFLNTMFVALIIVQIVLKLRKTIFIFLAAFCLFVFSAVSPRTEIGYPWCLDIACMASAFIVIGYLFEKKAEKVITTGKCLMITILGACLTMSYRMNIGEELPYVLMADRRIGNISLFFLSAIGGCLMCYGIVRILENEIKSRTVENTFTYLGIHTFEIFILHKPIIEILEMIFKNCSWHWSIQLVITGTSTLILVCIIGFLINCFAPCLFGRAPSKEN